MLLNQCPHNLDLFQWMFGMPQARARLLHLRPLPRHRGRGRRHRLLRILGRRHGRLHHLDRRGARHQPAGFSIKDAGAQHVAILRNFVDAILDGAPLIAPAAEGIHSVELANAILLSSWTDKPVDLPLDSALYARWTGETNR